MLEVSELTVWGGDEIPVVSVHVLVLVMQRSRLYEVALPVGVDQLTLIEVSVTLLYVGAPGTSGKVKRDVVAP